ncbi:MAG: hypothetical protein ACXVP7_13150 [Actinomycetota bacterium]
MEPESSPVERLREEAAVQGVFPSDTDLAAVGDFLDRILPALAEIEELVPPETAP